MLQVKYVFSGQVCVQATQCYFWGNAMTVLPLTEHFGPGVCTYVKCCLPTDLQGHLDQSRPLWNLLDPGDREVKGATCSGKVS